MANITVEKEGGERAALARPREAWDPLRAMREVMRWDPFGESLLSPLIDRSSSLSPAFEVKETKDAFQFQADVPGIEAKDLDVKLSDNRLTISGKREAEKTDKTDTYYTYERSYGSFSRSFVLPQGVNNDAINAQLKDGVLNVTVAKKPEAKPRQVQIKS